MWYFPVAFPAQPFRIARITHFAAFNFSEQVFVTPLTIAMDCPFAGFPDENDLWLLSQRKNGSMAQSIFCLEIICIEDVIVGNMAIVAGRRFPV
jgi:hypothetical protein